MQENQTGDALSIDVKKTIKDQENYVKKDV